MPRPRKPASPFRYFNSSPEVIRLAVSIGPNLFHQNRTVPWQISVPRSNSSAALAEWQVLAI
jgi:hypothetical protein